MLAKTFAITLKPSEYLRFHGQVLTTLVFWRLLTQKLSGSIMTSPDAHSHDNQPVYQMGEWQVLAAHGALTRDGHRVHVEPKLMDVLLCLIQARGELVTRETLLVQAWPRVVVNEEVLTRAISELRTLLGDVSRDRRYIKTVPKRGYILVMPVTIVTMPQAEVYPHSDMAAPRGLPVSAQSARPWSGFRHLRQSIMTIGMILATLTGYNMWSQLDSGQSELADRIEQQSAPQRQLKHELDTMHAFLNASKDTGDTVHPGATTILLAPLSALTEDAQTRAFAAGLAADLRHQLSQQPSFMVVHSGISEKFAPALILGGNVRIYRQQARVNLQLIETNTYRLVWSSSFDVKLQSPLDAQALIAKRVSIELQRTA